MKNQLTKLIMSSLLVAISFVSAADQKAAENLILIFNKTNTIQSKFKQEVKDGSEQIISTSIGTMIIQRPNRFRWETNTPMRQLAIADGQQIWVYQPDLEQVTISPMSHEIGQTPLAILSGSTASLEQNFTIQQKDLHEFILTARKNAVPFHTVILIFDAEQRLTQMQLKDELGQTTVLYFIDFRLNPVIAKNSFTFVIPKGIDVIHNS